MRLGHNGEAVRWADEALAIAEPRRLDRIVAEAFVNKGSALNGLGRLRESALLTGAAVTIAAQVGDVALELRARNNHAITLAYEDHVAALQAVLEACELATRVGIPQMAQWLVGTYALGSVNSGREWDTPLAMLEAELQHSRSAADRDRLLGIRRHLMTWRGEDTSAVRAEREAYRDALSDPDQEALTQLYPALEALVGGRFTEAIAGFRRAIPLAVQSAVNARYGFTLAAHWGRDLEAAREALRETQVGSYSGRYIDGLRILASAGLAALEGRSSEALAGMREAVETNTLGGYLFDAALAQLSALYLLPDEPSIAAWADEARACFETVKAPPLLARLEEAVATRVAP